MGTVLCNSIYKNIDEQLNKEIARDSKNIEIIPDIKDRKENERVKMIGTKLQLVFQTTI